MTAAPASISTMEIIRRPDGVAIRGEHTMKEFENYFGAKEELDQRLYLYLATLSKQEYQLEATQHSFKLETVDGRDARNTRTLEVQLVLHV